MHAKLMVNTGRRRQWFMLILATIVAMFIGNAPSARGADDGASQSTLPKKILCGYTGYSLKRSSLKQTIRDYLDPLQAAHFNAVQFKIYPLHLDMDNAGQLAHLRALAEAANKRGLALITYTYTSVKARDPKQDASLPPFVGKDGAVEADHFSLIDWEVWKKLAHNAFELAKASRTLPIAAVSLDLEVIRDTRVSYDAAAWKRFAKGHDVDPTTPAAKRYDALKRRGLTDAYVDWYHQQLERIAIRYERKMHRINPKLVLGMMPAKFGPLLGAFVKHLANNQVKAMIDGWQMYGGGGFTRNVLKFERQVKQANPNNLYVPWFRVNMYRPDDLTQQAYHAAMAADGYSMWTLRMLRPHAHEKRTLYQLPPAYAHDPGAYYSAFARANQRIRADMASSSAPEAVPFVPVKPLAPPLSGLDKLKVPQLKPVGDGSGKPQWITLRDPQVLFVYAKAGNPIRIDVHHVSGKVHPIALHYALVGKDHQRLDDATVPPGATRTIRTKAPYTGTYALDITGGSGGQAVYAVRIHNQHMGLRTPAYVFYRKPINLYVRRSKSAGAGHIVIHTNRRQVIAARLNDGPLRHGKKLDLAVPPGTEPIQLRLTHPDHVPSGEYVRDFLIHVQGHVEPYLADGPQRGLVRSPP